MPPFNSSASGAASCSGPRPAVWPARGRRHPRIPVHPRACGERVESVNLLATWSGSSPRVRGTVVAFDPDGRHGRFIPARAGNGRGPGSLWRLRAVHPRACGERIEVAHHRLPATGSSPRVRGTVLLVAETPLEGRFIPARAGNGPSTCLTTTPTTVHPRACGERPADQVPGKVKAGSSPRVRGTVVLTPTRSCRLRFIPARAGNGSLVTSGNITVTVHPRACGERFALPEPSITHTGSSPRVRGTD